MGGSVIGTRLSHFRILEQIGAGGMGIVYRAVDERLHREVAIKVLPPETLADETSRRRFHQEALALSRCNHPRIGVIHEFGTEGGVDFLVMELISGMTLAERLRKGALPEEEVIRIGSQIAEALEAAHAAGVVHGDLKPGNVMVTPSGVKVLDFGLARRIRERGALGETTRTETESITGTVPYMAPEQLTGKRAETRTDLWALGVVLYEMVTGRRPFLGTSSLTLAGAILHSEPERPRKIRKSIPSRFEALILRCLRKDPAARMQTATAVLEDLGRVQGTGVGPSLRLAGAAAVALALLVLGAVLLRHGVPWSLQPRGIRTIAVLPLENLTGDPQQDFFVDGMTDEITTALAQVSALRVISRTSSMQFKGKRMALPLIARALKADAVVEGTVRATSDLVRVSAQLIDGSTDRNLWAANFQQARENVLALQNDLARAVAEQIRAQLTPRERLRLATARRLDPQAHDAYLRGRYYYNLSFTEANLRRALDEFRQAIAIDPSYARAYTGVAESYCALSSVIIPAAEAMPKARAAAERALEIDSTLASARAALAYVETFYDWNWVRGERDFRIALELGPSEATAHQNYGYLLNNLGRFEEAKQELKRAAELDPLSSFISTQQLYPLYTSRHYDEAIEAATKVIESDSGAAVARFVRAQAYLAKGHRKLAYRELEHAYASTPMMLFRAYMGYIRGLEGDRLGAEAILHEFQSGGRFAQPYLSAVVYVGLGEKDKALEAIRKAIDEKSEEAAYMKVDPILDPLRSDPRYRGLLKRIGFTP
jgi:eukaryotic-like serine/threonine-protein kinase